jgi:ABC-2 type transport system permease protein
MKAELAKVRYLALPKYTAALIAAAVIITGIVLLVVAPSDPSKYIDIPDSVIGLIIQFGAIPSWIAGSIVGFGAGLLTRSLGGGIAVALIFVLALDGLVSFIPPLKHLSYGQLTSDMTDRIGGGGSPYNGLGVAILGTIVWCLILVVPRWLRFLRGDLK